MSRWLAPALCGAVSILTGFAALRAPSAPAAAAASPGPPAAPVLSARRVPGLVAQTAADSRLRVRLDTILADRGLGMARDRSCLVVRQQGRSIYQRRPTDLLTPASNLKLLTALAALRRIGSDARYATEVWSARPAAGGVIDGPLWLVGGGDPLLATADYAAHFNNQPQLVTSLEVLADRIRGAGVIEIRGGVIGDESRYDTQRYIPTWKATYVDDAEAGAQSALTVNDTFVVWKPKGRAAPAPATYAATVLRDLLTARGVVVGPVGEGKRPAGGTRVAAVESPPMAHVVGEMLRESDNLTAELIVKELGHRFGDRGSTAAGVAVMRATLQQAGIPATDLENVDGSGLDRSDKTTCRAIVTALDSPEREVIEDGLAVAGQSGTLAKRFVGHPAAGKVRAKTGSLDFVVGLSGWADPTRGPALLFALVANDLPDKTATGRLLQERVAGALVTYPEAPDSATLAPGA